MFFLGLFGPVGKGVVVPLQGFLFSFELSKFLVEKCCALL
jgi:hypothetical protein